MTPLEDQDRLDQLISRVIDGDAMGEDWSALSEYAAKDPMVWDALADAQRQHLALARSMYYGADRADLVALPVVETSGEGTPEHVPLITTRALGRIGWVAAAMIGVAWIITSTLLPDVRPDLGANRGFAAPAANLVPINNPQDALATYLTKGRETGQVLGQSPTMVLLDSQPADSGHGFQVIYVRPIIERAWVDDLYQLVGEDESGRPAVRPVSQSSGGSF